MVPKGRLLIIGGAEERSGSDQDRREQKIQCEPFEILKNVLPDGEKGERIEVITAASSSPEDMREIYAKSFKEIGFKDIGFIHIDDSNKAHAKKYYKRIAESKAVFFTGGDQLRLSTIVSGTELTEILIEKYLHEKGFTVAGTSAGAMAIPRLMICGGGITEALMGSDLNIASGLGFLDNCIVDTHFIKRGRFSRLAHAVIINPGNLGLGLGENTALAIAQGKNAVCIGSGMVVLIDGSEIQRSNISDAEAGSPVYVENLKVHLLTQHYKLNLETKEMEPPASRSSQAN